MSINWVNSSDQVVRDLYDGFCDFGAVGTSTLEAMADAGLFDLSVWKIIGLRNNTKFPLIHSSELYPESGVVCLPHVPRSVTELVRSALLSLGKTSDVAVQGKHAGFRPGADYSKMTLVEFQVDSAGTGKCPKGYQRNASSLLCEVCQPGFFSASYVNTTGATACIRCEEGYTSIQIGAKECISMAIVQSSSQYDPNETCASFPNKTLTIYVAAAEETVALTDQRWRPTFDTVINNYMNRFDCYFNMVPMTLPNLKIALEQGKVDFIYCDSGVYTLFKHSHGARALATSLRTYLGRAYIQEGGTIYRKKGKNDDLFTLEDLQAHAWVRNLTLCPLAAIAFSGNQVQLLPHVPQEIASSVTLPKLAIQGYEEAAVVAGLSGLCKETNVNFALDINQPSGVCAPGSKRNTTHPLSRIFQQPTTKCEKCPEGLYSTSFGSTTCNDSADTFEYNPIEACSSFPNNTLTIYVAAAEKTVALTDERWRPTFEK
eukprot:g550.t1